MTKGNETDTELQKLGKVEVKIYLIGDLYHVPGVM